MENREKLQTFLNMNNLNRKQFADLAGIQVASLHRWFSGYHKSFKEEAIKKIVKACEEIVDQSDLSREYMMKKEDF